MLVHQARECHACVLLLNEIEAGYIQVLVAAQSVVAMVMACLLLAA